MQQHSTTYAASLLDREGSPGSHELAVQDGQLVVRGHVGGALRCSNCRLSCRQPLLGDLQLPFEAHPLILYRIMHSCQFWVGYLIIYSQHDALSVHLSKRTEKAEVGQCTCLQV